MPKRLFVIVIVAVLGAAVEAALAGWDEGIAAFKSKDFVTAAAEFRVLVQENPESHAGHFMLGQSLEQLRRHEEALHHLRRAYDLKPNDLTTRFALGRSYFSSQRYDEVVELLDAVDVGTLPPAQQAALYQIRGQARRKRDDLEGALGDFEALAGLRPSDATLQFNYGSLAVTAGQLDRGLEALDRASQLAPSDPDIQRTYARTLLRKARQARDRDTRRRAYERASRVAAEVVALEPSYEHLILKAETELGAGQYGAAIETCKTAVAQQEADWLAFFYLGQAYASNGQHQEAESPLHAALARTDRSEPRTMVWKQLGFAYEKQKKYAESISAYQNGGHSEAVARVQENQETQRQNRLIEEENKRIQEMMEEAKKLEEELKALEGGSKPKPPPPGAQP